ncbi:hypothetical protein ETU10_10520 [Apibacter muscae]|uniref:hypothetical protein n=1 Tax=Apibacter muscae TaxID=2509004 RepID=UPI0011AC9D27|nr:hypothetical protein [Apibacter muscae]TWP22631.1 hypothetical protein ETU10_10520 [Apibacter muscae]
MKYLIVDANLGGTGIRDTYNGGYIELNSLSLSEVLKRKINNWLKNYHEEHYKGYLNLITIENLDKEGIKLAKDIKKELGEVKVEYFSDAKLIKQIII